MNPFVIQDIDALPNHCIKVKSLWLLFLLQIRLLDFILCVHITRVQKWLGNDFPPTQWGWNMTAKGLVPIITDKDPSPPDLLNIVSCRCFRGFRTATCSCRKAELKCSVMCASCKELSCSNPYIIVDEENCDYPIDTTLENFLLPESETTHGIE